MIIDERKESENSKKRLGEGNCDVIVVISPNMMRRRGGEKVREIGTRGEQSVPIKTSH